MDKVTIPAAKVSYANGVLSIIVPRGFVQLIEYMVKSCNDKRGGYASITISHPRRPRSTGKNSQNAHFNGHCQQIAAATGNDFAVVKRYVKHEAVSMGYPLSDGVGLDGLMNTKSEADASVEECRILIDAVHRLAAELDISLVEEA